MSKKINSYWYSLTHRVIHNPPLEFIWANGNVGEIHYTFEQSEDNYLYSLGRYETKIKEEDLPPEYYFGRWFKQWGYINTSMITDMCYKPNNWANHLFRDDSLYLKFSGTLEEEYIKEWDMVYVSNYDIIVDGWDMVGVIAYANKFTDKDFAPIIDQIRNKVKLYLEKYPDEHDAVTIEKFEELYEDYKRCASLAKDEGMTFQQILDVKCQEYFQQYGRGET